MKSSFFLPVKNNYAEFILNGDSYCETYLSSLRKAKKIIHLQTYIFNLDNFGKAVYEELVLARRRGVLVYVVLDAVGSREFNIDAEKELVKEGISFFRFNSIRLKWLYRWGRRLHHKVLLIDQDICIIGGINVHSPSAANNKEPRLDFAVLVKGPILYKIDKYIRSILRTSFRNNVKLLSLINETTEYTNGIEIGIAVNDWVYGRRKITEQYSELTRNAQKEITIISSYFFPRKKFMKQLVNAAKRGVKVRLILPTFSDWPSYVKASEYLYSYFLKNGVEIYLWKKSILHGKLASIDGKWSTIGSFNLNYTSYQQNLEINVNIYSFEFTTMLDQKINNLIEEGADKIDVDKFYSGISLKNKFLRFFYYVILALIANFSLGLTFPEENNKENRIYNLIRVVGAILLFVLGICALVVPFLPSVPFFIVSLLLMYRQILVNKNSN